jgi:hypothetical protein
MSIDWQITTMTYVTKEYVMSKPISTLVFALVLLGFLIATTMFMYGDMEELKNENRELSGELKQLKSDYDATIHQRDTLKAENADLHSKLNLTQNAYIAENQARLKAESEAAIYKNMAVNMANNIQTSTELACTPMEKWAANSEVLLSSAIPASTSSLITLTMVGLVAYVTNRYQRRKKLKNLPARLAESIALDGKRR